jgi:hypothetical protein
MYQEYKDLLSAFHAHGVRYLIVGGYVVIYHAQPRFTKDIDLFIKAADDLIASKLAAGRPQGRTEPRSATRKKKPPEPTPGSGPGQ